jgi:branched-chain amino acid transport system ATP-binding protein
MATPTQLEAVNPVESPRSTISRLVGSKRGGFITIAVLVGAALVASQMTEGYTAFILATTALTVTVGVGLNILLGLSGQISFGHVGFFALGAYASGILVAAGYSFWLGLLMAGVVTFAVGALLAVPALRVTGPYLAMVTIAFAFIVEHGLIEWRELTGGANGLATFTPLQLFGYDFTPNDIATLAVLLAGAALAFFWQLKSGAWGLVMQAVRDSEVAAQSVGLNPLTVKSASFVLSAVLTGLAGAVFTPLNGFISPGSFPFSQSILFILAVVVGGSGTLLGPVIGAAIVVILPEYLSDMAEYRLLIFGGLLLGVLWAAPRGVVGSITRFFEAEPPAPAMRSPRVLSDIVGADGALAQLKVSGLKKAFGGVRAVDDVSFSASPGQITSVIGPNGAGKTTVLNLVSGFYVPDAGTVRLGSVDVTGQPSHRVSQAGLARTYQTTQLFSDLTVLENIAIALKAGHPGSIFADAMSDSDLRDAEDLLVFVGYTGPLARRASALPHIDRRLVEVARALATRPKVLLLDEPAAGLTQDDKVQLAGLLSEIAATGIGVVVVEHDMSLVMSISDSIVVLDGGNLLATGTPAEIRENADVRRAYLGGLDYQGRPRGKPWSGEQRAVLATLGLTAGYGAAPAISDIEIVVNAGEMVAVLGANGAGKSTLLRAMSGLHRPVRGTILLDDEKVQDKPAYDIVAAGLALVPEGRQVFPELTARDNIKLGAFRRGEAVSEAEFERVIARFPRLRERLDSRAGVLSGGEQQMLAIARGMMIDPKILLLDEPSLGLAPSMIGELYDLLAELRDEGVTILIVDQMANLALTIADRGYILSNGCIVQSGSSAELQAGAVEQAYLGTDNEPAGATRERSP